MTDEGAVVNGMVAPPGYQFRSLRQNSVWGEQPNPEETEKMMIKADDNVYMTAAGYITRMDDPLSKLGKEDEEKDDKLGDDAAGGERKRSKKKVVISEKPQIIGNVLDDPDALSKLGVCLDEDTTAPIDLLPPSWMKHCTIAPAPRRSGPDRPLQIAPKVPANDVPDASSPRRTSPPRRNNKKQAKMKK